MSSGVSLGLLILGPFIAIAFAARGGNFRPLTVAVAALIGELFGIVIWAGLNYFLAARVLAGKRSGAVGFFPQRSSFSDQLVTGAFIIACALAVAATVLLGRWVYGRARG
jgi:hypothetical protein